MPRRVAIAVLAAVAWSPPGIDPMAWRLALAEDTLDVLATLAEVDAAVAVAPADIGLLEHIGWPGLHPYVVSSLDVRSVFTAAAAHGYDQAVLLTADAPDLPGMLIAKLLRPLSTRPVAACGATGDPGLLGLAAALPAPDWLPAATLDELTPQTLHRLAPRVTEVAPATGWRRLRSAADLAHLDPRLEGWDATRALLRHSTGPRSW